jgi:hypothetical protein
MIKDTQRDIRAILILISFLLGMIFFRMGDIQEDFQASEFWTKAKEVINRSYMVNAYGPVYLVDDDGKPTMLPPEWAE